MRVLHRRVIGAVALGLWLLLGWDSHVYWSLGFFGAWPFPFIPLAFYFFGGAALVWIITGESKP